MSLCFFTILSKGNNFHDLKFASPEDEALQDSRLLLKERICSLCFLFFFSLVKTDERPN